MPKLAQADIQNGTDTKHIISPRPKGDFTNEFFYSFGEIINFYTFKLIPQTQSEDSLIRALVPDSSLSSTLY